MLHLLVGFYSQSIYAFREGIKLFDVAALLPD